MYLVLVNLIPNMFSFDSPPFESPEAPKDEAGILLTLTIPLPRHFSGLFEKAEHAKYATVLHSKIRHYTIKSRVNNLTINE